MRNVQPPLSELSLAEKLDLLESLWTDLAKDEKALKSPAWHETILKDRENAFAAGNATASDWEESKGLRKGSHANTSPRRQTSGESRPALLAMDRLRQGPRRRRSRGKNHKARFRRPHEHTRGDS